MWSPTALFHKVFYRFRNLIIYGIIGALSAGLDFLVFFILTNTLSINYMPANIFSVLCGITNSFFLNRAFNFKVKDKLLKRMLIFFSVGFSGLLMSSALLYIFIERISLTEIPAKLLSIVLVVLIQFILNKYITFKKEAQ